MELSLKLELEKTFFRIIGTTTKYNRNVRSTCLASWRNNWFILTEFKAKKQNPNDPHKEVKSEQEMWFFWAVVAGVPVLVA